MRFNFYLSVTISLILLLTGTSWARIRVSPHLSLIEEYTDNLYLTANDEEEDWITTAVPGIGLVYDSAPLDFDIDYSLRFRHYGNHDKENEISLRDIQRATAHGLLFPERNFRIFLDGEISRVSVDERGPAAEDNELVNSTNLYRYAVNPQYLWQPVANFSATLGYRYENSDYQSEAGDDNQNHEYNLLLNHKVSSATDLRINYSFLDHHADLNQEFEQQTLTAGFLHRFGPRLTLEADGGPVQTNYPDGSETRGRTWTGTGTYTFSEALSLNLSYQNGYTVSVSRGQIKREQVSAGFIYQGRATIETTIYWSNDEYVEEMTEDRRLGGTFSIHVQHDQHYHTSVFYTAEYQQYFPGVEEAVRQSTGATVGYTFNKGDVSLGYQLRGRDSTIDAHDYWANIFTLNGSLRY